MLQTAIEKRQCTIQACSRNPNRIFWDSFSSSLQFFHSFSFICLDLPPSIPSPSLVIHVSRGSPNPSSTFADHSILYSFSLLSTNLAHPMYTSSLRCIPSPYQVIFFLSSICFFFCPFLLRSRPLLIPSNIPCRISEV